MTLAYILGVIGKRHTPRTSGPSFGTLYFIQLLLSASLCSSSPSWRSSLCDVCLLCAHVMASTSCRTWTLPWQWQFQCSRSRCRHCSSPSSSTIVALASYKSCCQSHPNEEKTNEVPSLWTDKNESACSLSKELSSCAASSSGENILSSSSVRICSSLRWDSFCFDSVLNIIELAINPCYFPHLLLNGTLGGRDTPNPSSRLSGITLYMGKLRNIANTWKIYEHTVNERKCIRVLGQNKKNQWIRKPNPI